MLVDNDEIRRCDLHAFLWSTITCYIMIFCIFFLKVEAPVQIKQLTTWNILWKENNTPWIMLRGILYHFTTISYRLMHRWYINFLEKSIYFTISYWKNEWFSSCKSSYCNPPNILDQYNEGHKERTCWRLLRIKTAVKIRRYDPKVNLYKRRCSINLSLK